MKKKVDSGGEADIFSSSRYLFVERKQNRNDGFFLMNPPIFRNMKFSLLQLSLWSGVCLLGGFLPCAAEDAPGVGTVESREAAFSAEFKKEDVLKIGNKVAEWQMENFAKMPSSSDPTSWLNGALYLGMMDWADLTQDQKYDQWLKKLFDKFKWQPAPRMYHADDICISQTYLDMYRKHKKKGMYYPTEARAEWVMNHPSAGSMDLNYSTPGAMPCSWLRLYMPECML